MTQVWPFYGAAMGAVTVRTWTADNTPRIAALALSVDWLASNLMRWLAPFDYRPIFRLTDIAFATVFCLAWFTYRRQWMVVLSALYLISGLIGLLAYGPGSLYSFDLALNTAFLARLAVVWIASSEPRKTQEHI